MRFLDTNIFLRHFTQDHPSMGPAASNLLSRIAQGEETVYTSQAVIFEVVFTLERGYKVPKGDVANLVLPLLRLGNLRVPNKKLLREAFRLHISYSIGFVDAFNAAYMLAAKQPETYSWDEDFDKVPGIRRVEP